VLISVLGFGSIWMRRGAAPEAAQMDRAYYNTTGVLVAGKVRNRPRLYGVARFNASSGFRPDSSLQAVHKVFECEPPCVWEGRKKVVFKARLPHPARPDAYLVAVTADQLGGFDKHEHGGWRHHDAQLISFSECRDQQEVMLVMPPFSWIRGRLGTFFLEPDAKKPWRARLVLSATV
jgi:hypothetical protein